MGNRNLAIFDFDGTIADSAAWFGSALNELARHNGFREVSDEQREMLRGLSTREIFAYLGIPPGKLPLVVRLEGNNVAAGKKTLAESGLTLITGDSMADAAKKVVKAVNA